MVIAELKAFQCYQIAIFLKPFSQTKAPICLGTVRANI